MILRDTKQNSAKSNRKKETSITVRSARTVPSTRHTAEDENGKSIFHNNIIIYDEYMHVDRVDGGIVDGIQRKQYDV